MKKITLIEERNARRAARALLRKRKRNGDEATHRGVGDILSDMIQSRTGAPPCQKFCRATAGKMNSWGAARCRENCDELAAEIRAHVSRMGWASAFGTKAIAAVVEAAAGDAVYRALVLRACELSDSRPQG